MIFTFVNLPNAEAAHVDREKIVSYLLAADHPEGAGKAQFLARFGFTVEQWEILEAALIAHAQANPVKSVSETRYGTKYRIDGLLQCPDGRTPAIRAVWIVDSKNLGPRLVTAHPV